MGEERKHLGNKLSVKPKAIYPNADAPAWLPQRFRPPLFENRP